MNKTTTIKAAFKKQLSLVVILFTSVYCLYYVYENKWKGSDGEGWRRVIDGDGLGFYAYLPCVFIHHKFDFNKIIDSENECRRSRDSFWQFPQYSKGKLIDKDFAGAAFLIMPFFLVAYFLSNLLGYEIGGGYSFLFAAAVSIAALFYITVGLVFIRKLLKLYSIPDHIICLVLLFGVFATNLFYYATYQAAYGHTYSFGICAVFLYYAKRSINDGKFKYIILMTIALGILTIIRPTNILDAFLIPFLAGDWKKTVEFIRGIFNPKKLFILFGVFVVILFIQFTCWKIETGNFLLWSYPDGGFNFNQIHFFDILFSYRNGWFVYTPIMFFIILLGLIFLMTKSRFQFSFFLLFTVIIVYVLSSWMYWWYMGFGLRAFIDFYPSFLLLFSIFFSSIRGLAPKISIIVLCSMCVGLNMQQTYQFTHFILPYEKMTKEKYWKIFLKSSNLYCGILENPDTTKYKFIDSLSFKNDFENNQWGNDKTINSDVAHSGSHSVLMNSDNNDSPEFIMDGARIKSIKNLNIYINVWAFMKDLDNDAKVLVYINNKEGNATSWLWKSFKGFVSEKNTWTQGYFIFQLPEMKDGDKIHALVNTSKGSAYVDDMVVKFCTPL